MLVQRSGATMCLGLLAMHPSEVGIVSGRGFTLGLPLVLQCSGRALLSSQFAFERGLVHSPVVHRRNIAPNGLMSNQSSGNQTRRSRPASSTIRLLAAVPDLADFLTPEERQGADRIGLPVLRLGGPVEISERLERENAFAALVIDGMVLRQLRLGEQPTLRIFAPGEIVATG